MKKHLLRRTLLLLVATAAVAAAAVASATAGTTSSSIVYQANPPHTFVTSSAAPGAFDNPFCHAGNLVCYSPNDIRTAYGYPSSLSGSGQTIVIVDAYGSPTIKSDLAVFDKQYGLAAPPSFKVECPQGCPSFSPNANGGNEVGWAEETSLDVEWAHAMAPGANIVLVVAATNYGNALNAAESVAIQEYPGSVMSQSFGSFESSISGGGNNIQLQQAHQNYQAAAAAGITVLASAGDWGATNTGTSENAVYPASDPLVTGIGGTEGNPYYNGLAGQPLPKCTKSCSLGLAQISCTRSGACTTTGYGGEQVWNEPYFAAATGGAESLIFSASDAPFQANDGLGDARRTTPDVSYNATISGGVLTYLGFLGANSGWYIFGGTSAGSPQWAAIVALVNQARAARGEASLGYLNDRLYQVAESGAYSTDFHDMTVGNNELAGTPFGYTAHAGYDIGSGWGTPRVANLVGALAGS